MAVSFGSLTELDALAFDDVIDVRSPGEFAQDHVPGAINLPVLGDAERAEVGTLYVQHSRFSARKMGAAMVARNTASHLDGPLADRGGDWRPLVYCWRGGQRSGSFATILKQIGWRVELLEGGYKSYRRLVVNALYDAPVQAEIILIAGGTGTGKTKLLGILGAMGAQVIDLEGLAGHRGSVFGHLPNAQPSQKMFESRLAAALERLDSNRPVYLEAESNKIGDIAIPPQLWDAMRRAPRAVIEAPRTARAEFLRTAYGDLLDDPEVLASKVTALGPYHAKTQIEAWHAMAASGDYAALAEGLIEHHYDPRYARSEAQRPAACRLELADISLDALTRAAEKLIAKRIL